MKQLSAEVVRSITSSQCISSMWSVVKELMENSLDSRASNIDIKLENYGLDIIEVRDNGSGISTHDMPYVGLPHYTSKLSSIEDLNCLETYGFRGEAMGSLCAVAEVTITTKTSDDAVGSTYKLDSAGNIVDRKPSHLPNGTTVTAENLFQKFPVRRQYYATVKKKKEEQSRVLHLVTSYGIIRHNVRFVLKCDRETMWQKHSLIDLRSALLAVIGSEAMASMRHIVKNCPINPEILVEAFLPTANESKASSRATDDWLFVYVNHRPVQMKSISKLVREHYVQATQCSDRYPVAFIHLLLPSGELDVNLEPNKHRVMFQNEKQVLNFLKQILVEFYDTCSRESNLSSAASRISDQSQNENRNPNSGDSLRIDTAQVNNFVRDGSTVASCYEFGKNSGGANACSAADSVNEFENLGCVLEDVDDEMLLQFCASDLVEEEADGKDRQNASISGENSAILSEDIFGGIFTVAQPSTEKVSTFSTDAGSKNTISGSSVVKIAQQLGNSSSVDEVCRNSLNGSHADNGNLAIGSSVVQQNSIHGNAVENQNSTNGSCTEGQNTTSGSFVDEMSRHIGDKEKYKTFVSGNSSNDGSRKPENGNSVPDVCENERPTVSSTDWSKGRVLTEDGTSVLEPGVNIFCGNFQLSEPSSENSSRLADRQSIISDLWSDASSAKSLNVARDCGKSSIEVNLRSRQGHDSADLPDRPSSEVCKRKTAEDADSRTSSARKRSKTQKQLDMRTVCIDKLLLTQQKRQSSSSSSVRSSVSSVRESRDFSSFESRPAVTVSFSLLRLKHKSTTCAEKRVSRSCKLIGQLRSLNSGLCLHDGCISLFDPTRARERLIFHRLMNTYVFPSTPLPSVVQLNNLNLDGMLPILLSMKKSEQECVDPFLYYKDERLIKNGFKIRQLYKGPCIDVTEPPELVEVTGAVNYVGLKELCEVLSAVKQLAPSGESLNTTSAVERHMPSGDWSNSRPATLRHFLEGEAVRMVRQDCRSLTNEELRDIFNDFKSSFSNVTRCIHDRPIFHKLCDISTLSTNTY